MALFLFVIIFQPCISAAQEFDFDKESRAENLRIEKAQKAIEKLNYCSKDSDCLMQQSACESIAIHKKKLKEFQKWESDVTLGCVETTQCKAVKCEKRKCIVKDCSKSPI